MKTRHKTPLSLLRQARKKALDAFFTPSRSTHEETSASRLARSIEPKKAADGHPLALEIVEICSWMYQKGFIVSSEGNVSASLEPDRILVTPRGMHKGLLWPEQLVVTDLAGRQISGDLPPSSELPLHLLVYRERPDVKVVIHAHPTMAIVCSLAGISFDDGVVPEVITSLGGIPIAPYATPGTDEAAEVISPFIQQFDAIVLARHGSVTVGRDLREAYSKLEMLEHTAQILVLTRLLGPLSPLPKDEVARLLIAGGRHPVDGSWPRSTQERPLWPGLPVGE
jgi:L-fuculose-phosphate aldolase